MLRQRAPGRLLLLILLGVLSCARPIAQAEAPPDRWPDPASVWVSDQELLLDDPYTRGFRSRYWYFNGLLTDGITFTLSLFQWRYGALGGPGLLLVVSEPGGPTLMLERRIDERDFQESRQRLAVRFGDSELDASRYGCSVRLRLPELDCDLELRNLLNPWRPGDGYLHLSPEAYTRHTVLSPFATVSGHLRVSGSEKDVQGWCYSDRGVVAVPMRRVNPEEYSFRVFGPNSAPGQEPWMISALHSVTAEAYGSRRLSSLLAGRGRQWVLATKANDFQALDFAPGQGSPYPYPRRIRVRAVEEGCALEGQFVVTRLIALNDILARLPRPLRQVAEAFINRPVIHRLEGYFIGSVALPDGTSEALYLAGQGEYSVFR